LGGGVPGHHHGPLPATVDKLVTEFHDGVIKELDVNNAARDNVN
jgi:hypothetical protein